MPQDLFCQLAEFWRARQVGAIARQIDPGQHDFGMAALDQRADLIDHRAHRHRTRIAAAIGDDAERAAVIAAVLHLHEYPRQAFLKSLQEMRRHLLDRHDVGDRDLFLAGNAECRRRVQGHACGAPCLAVHLVFIADDAVDFCHRCEHLGLRLRCAAGHHDPSFRPLALQPPDRLPRLRHGFVGHRATVDDDGIGEPSALSLPRNHFGFERVEAAAEGDDVNAHLRRRWQMTLANNAGSNRPSYSNVAVPVIKTWSSRSRHSMERSPPGSEMLTMRLARFSRAAATAVAQAAEPQAFVSPAPRSKVRIAIWSRSTICASVIFARSGKIGWFSNSGPKRPRS